MTTTIIHNLMVGENLEDIQLFQGKTLDSMVECYIEKMKEEWLANRFSLGEKSDVAKKGVEVKGKAVKEELAQKLQHSSAFVLDNSPVFYQYVVTTITL
jgi:hypothetical protein